MTLDLSARDTLGGSVVRWEIRPVRDCKDALSQKKWNMQHFCVIWCMIWSNMQYRIVMRKRANPTKLFLDQFIDSMLDHFHLELCTSLKSWDLTFVGKTIALLKPDCVKLNLFPPFFNFKVNPSLPVAMKLTGALVGWRSPASFFSLPPELK